MTVAYLRSDVVILASAVSGAIHAALAPGHFDEGAGQGLGFVLAAAALAGVVVWLTRRPGSRRALVAAAALFAGLIGGYALATTTGLPVLHPGPEPLDGLALATKAIEAVGLLAATSLLRCFVAVPLPQPKGTPT